MKLPDQKREATSPRDREADNEFVAGSFRAADSALKGVLRVIDLSNSPLFSNSMFAEAQTLKGQPNEEPQGDVDSFYNFFDGVDSTATEDVTGLGDLPMSRKSPSSGTGGSSSSPKLVNHSRLQV